MADLQAHTQRWRHHRAPTFARVDDDTADLLGLIAEDPRKDDEYALFLRACWQDAMAHGHYVSVQRVRRRMSNEHGLIVHPRTYSAFWSRACAKGGPMVTTVEWDLNDDKRGKNSGKPQRLRKWVGGASR